MVLARHLTTLAMLAAMAGARPAHAEEKDAIAPATPWTLDYAADSCALRRQFGEPDDRVFFEMRRFAPDLDLQTIVASNSMKARNPPKLKYRFGDRTDWREGGSPNAVKLSDGSSGVIFVGMLVELPELDEIEDLAKREAYLKEIGFRAFEIQAAMSLHTFSLRGAFRKKIQLDLGPLAPPIQALDQCINALMTHWNIDVEAHKSLTRPALPNNLPEVPRMMDYPPKMLAKGLEGLVNVRLAVDEAGKITDCFIQMPLSDPAFEKSTCADLQHALEFDPALDKDGKPIASYWITRVSFRIN